MRPIYNNTTSSSSSSSGRSRRNKTRPDSPSPPKSVFNESSPDHHRTHNKLPPPTAALIDQELVSVRDRVASSSMFEELEQLQVSKEAPNPRSFPYNVKQQCWDKADKVKGRDSDRWRRDPIGNIVFRKLVGCPGCLCHDYDHILPYSKDWDHVFVYIVLRFEFHSSSLKWIPPFQEALSSIVHCCSRLVVYMEFYESMGGPSTLENCQVLQATVNRSKGNKTELSRADLIRRSSYCRVADRDMDLIELSAYGNVRRAEDAGGCRIQ
ncbi:hypothetical protein ACFE04_009191 [Oxalis oulophora]